MKIELLSSADRDIWDAYVNGHPDSSHCHLSGWREVIGNTYGHKGYYLLARDSSNGKIRGVLPLIRVKSRLFSDCLVSMPFLNLGGVLADSDLAAKKVLAGAFDLLRELGLEHIELRQQNPLTDPECARDHNSFQNTSKVRMLLDLPATDQQLMASFGSKLRNQISRPQKSGMRTSIGGHELLDDYYDVFAVHMRDLGSPVHSKALFLQALKVFEEKVRLGVVHYEGIPVAAGFLLLYRGVAEIIWASSLIKYKRLSPNMLLYRMLMKHAVEAGCKTFDFGRSTINEGTYQFKKQWGAAPVALHWRYWSSKGDPARSMDQGSRKNRAAVELWKKLPVPLSVWLGPKIRRSIPL